MKHAIAIAGGGEYTLCGVAFDAFESGDAEQLVQFAIAGALVTCKDCRATIDYVQTFKRYRAPIDVDATVSTCDNASHEKQTPTT